MGFTPVGVQVPPPAPTFSEPQFLTIVIHCCRRPRRSFFWSYTTVLSRYSPELLVNAKVRHGQTPAALVAEQQHHFLVRGCMRLQWFPMAKLDRDIVQGRLACHPDGYGFVVPDDPNARGDIFIPAGKMRHAAHGDQVVVRIVAPDIKPARGRPSDKPRKGPEGEVVKVLARAREEVVGKIFHYRQEVFVAPLDPRYHYTIRLVDDRADSLEAGVIVAASILVQPGKNQMPLGELAEVLGEPDDPEIQYKIVCRLHGIPLEFPESVLDEAEAAREISGEELTDREDFREELTVTIDGETARDFDDAITIDKNPDGSFILKVHIADVAHYVPSGSSLDVEALARGTSVYFPDRAIPMLPPRLSNGLCSLNPDVDRLAVTVVMQVARKGQVEQASFHNSVIRSDERMTYTAVKKILLDNDPELRRRYSHLVERFEWMLELCEILNARRRRAGAIDFDLPEAEIEYDANGGVRDIVRAERNKAHRIIEEFMLLANQTVAEYLESKSLPVVYRIHEEPDPTKVESFLEVAVRFGYSLEKSKSGSYPSRSFQKFMEAVSGTKEGQFLSYLMLRSFKQARYSVFNQGHFGLAMQTYCHFTSPIRRYPDLAIHRLLKQAISPEVDNDGGEGASSANLEAVADQSSDRERQAVEAERAIMKWLMADFMSARIGEEFDAFIVGMKHNGFFVEILQHYVEGFVPVQTLWDDFYVFNARAHCLIGEKSHKVFSIGDQVRVRVDKVNRDRHLIDFSVVIETPGKKKRRRERGRPRA